MQALLLLCFPLLSSYLYSLFLFRAEFIAADEIPLLVGSQCLWHASGLLALSAIAASGIGKRAGIPLIISLALSLFVIFSISLYAANFLLIANLGQTLDATQIATILWSAPYYLAGQPKLAAYFIGMLALLAFAYVYYRSIIAEALIAYGKWMACHAYFLLMASAIITVAAGILMTRNDLLNRFILHDPISGLFQSFSSDITPIEPAPLVRQKPLRPANIILISIDAWRAASASFHGYRRNNTPFISSLIENGRAQHVRWAFSACATSTCGIIGMLSSRNAFNLQLNQTRLPDVLKGAGYKNYIFGSGIHSQWRGMGNFYGHHIDHFSEYHSADDRRIVQDVKKLPPFRQGKSRPAFFFFHLMSSHSAGRKFPQYNLFRPSEPYLHFLQNIQRSRKPIDYSARRSSVMDAYVNYYDNGILQADDITRQILAILGGKHYLDDAIIVITSDHGEALGERGWNFLGHPHQLYNEVMHIPLIFMDTRAQARLKNDYYATHEDIAPSLLDAIGVAPPPDWTGYSLLREAARTTSFHHSFWVSRPHRQKYEIAMLLRTGDTIYKMLCNEKRGGKMTCAMYNLNEDPLEMRPLPDTSPYFYPMQMRISKLKLHASKVAPSH